MKDINYISSLDVSAPGLIDPGIIILGKTTPVPGSDRLVKFEEDPYVQYKVSTNKFLGYIGDLAEYKFKHIPEKWYYNNISVLELLNDSDQTYIGTKLPILDAVSKHAVFTELTKDNFKDSASLPDSNYNKFEPRYFGTSILEDKTVMLFMVPPGYNAIFVSNGSDIYSQADALRLYGPQILLIEETNDLYNNMPYHYSPNDGTIDVIAPVKLSWTCVNVGEDITFDVYLSKVTDEWPRDPNFPGIHATSVTVSSLDSGTAYRWKVIVKNGENEIYEGETLTFTTKSFNLNAPNFGPSSSLSGDLDIHPVDVEEYSQVEVMTDTISDQTSSEEDANSQPTTGRGRGSNTGVPPTVSVIDENYSLVINNETGMSVVVSNSDLFVEENADINPNISLYAHEFANSPYTFKKLQTYNYYVKLKTSYSWYHKLESISSEDLKSYLESVISKPGHPSKNVFEAINKEFVESSGDYDIYLVYVYINIDKSQTNLRTVSKYKKIDETETYRIFKEVTEYNDKDIKGYQVIKIKWNITLYTSTDNFDPTNCCTILTDDGFLTKGPSGDDCWYVKDYKEEESSAPTHEVVDGREGNLDTEGFSPGYPLVERWETMYGLANYYEYIKGASQLEIHLDSDYEDYYKLIKLVISPNGGQVLGFKEIDSSTSDINVNAEDIIEIGGKFYLLSENLILIETTATESDHVLGVGDEIVMGGRYYILQYLPSTSNIESFNVVNLGYKTSDNPLKNLDKYLVRDTEFVKKYSTLNSNIVDLTSGSYLSTGIREKESDSSLDFIKYSYRKNYRKGQSVLLGLPEDLDTTIVDINRIIPSIWVEDANDISVPESILGDIIYDYNSGLICKITKENDIYNVDIDSYTEDVLYRYRNEYYLYRSRELIRTGKLGIRTWTSLYDNNKGNFPGLSRGWMSRDGNLSKEDKVWVMIISNEGRKKVLGTIARKRVEGVELEGLCLRLMTGYLGRTVTLNGVEVSVDSMELQYEGVPRDFQDLYLIRQVSQMSGDVLTETRGVADITNNLVFKDRINYVTV